MTNPLLSYLPHHLASALANEDILDPLAHSEHIDAVVLFADVSGFTPLSEALARHGRRGAEELTQILNGYFSAMIALLESYGGIVCKFGGDAVLTIFPYKTGKHALVTRRVVQCAHAMQAAMTAFTQIESSVGRFRLAMKIGLARGAVLSASVGDPALRLEHITAGSVLDRCANAEHHAQPGDVIASAELLPDLAKRALVEMRDTFAVLQGSLGTLRPTPLPPIPMPSPQILELLTRYTHPSIAQRVLAQQSSFINEHRLVTVLFIRFSNLDYDHDPQSLALLQAFSQDVIALISHYDGFLNRIDMGDKGSKLIVLFGAPVAHEDDPQRGIGFALDLQAHAHKHGLTLAMGVTAGFVYCGHVGSAQRQEYTVMGDTVNLAARLMQHASEGDVLASASIWEATKQVFDWESLPLLQVKGKREPVAVYRAKQLRSGTIQAQPQLAMIGRSAEQRRMSRMLALAQARRGQLLLLHGEAGMGKSRLLDTISNLAMSKDLAVYRGSCQAYGASYQGWSTLLRALFGIDAQHSIDQQYAWLEERLAGINSRLTLRTPLLAGPLGLPLPDNNFTSTLDPQLRAELAHGLVLECVRGLAHTPIVLIIDNGQWLDALGLSLLELLTATIHDLPILLIFATRSAAALQHMGAKKLPYIRSVVLSAMPPTEATALVRACWTQSKSERDLPSALEQQILARAQGNPLYIEELVTYAQQQPQASSEEKVALPETLQQLLLSRIDQLDSVHQTTLKAASVLGSSFRMRWLIEGYAQLGSEAQLHEHLAALQRHNLTILERAEPEPEYRFCHTLLQETAYESMAFATRASLHEQLGQYLEQIPDERGLLDSLAYHYGRSERQDKQRIYFRRAGDAAAASYANSAALSYFQRLLPLLTEGEQATVLHSMAEIWRLTGEWHQAEAAIRQALTLATDAPLIAAECACTLGAILARTQSYSTALPFFQQAYATLQEIPGAALSRTLEQLSFAHFQLGDLNAALRYAEQHLTLAEQIGDQLGHCDASAQIGYIALQRGKTEQALATQQQVYDTAMALGYRRRVVLAASDIAEIYWSKGNMSQALDWLLISLEEANSIGYRWVLGMMIGNAGLIYAREGDTEQALICFQRALTLALELGNRPGITQTLGWLAGLFGEKSSLALPICKRAIMLARELDLVYELSEQLELSARLLFQRQEYGAALRDCEEALELAQRSEADDITQRSQCLRLRLLVASGTLSPSDACTHVEELLQSCTDEAQRAALLLTHWQLDPTQHLSKNEAASFFRTRYISDGNADDRRSYAELTGEWMPHVSRLAALPQELLSQIGDLHVLLHRAGVTNI